MKSYLLPAIAGVFVRWAFTGFKGSYRVAEERFGRSVLTYVLGFAILIGATAACVMILDRRA